VMAALCFPLAPFFPFTILLMAALSIPQSQPTHSDPTHKAL
jgi:hypothetical protein